MSCVVKSPLYTGVAARRRHDGDLTNPSSHLKIAGSVFCNKFSYKLAASGKFSIKMAANHVVQSIEPGAIVDSKSNVIPIMVNGCTGKMGRAVLEAAIAAGLSPVPVALGGPEDSGKVLDIDGRQIEVNGPEQRESILSSVFKDYPDLIVVDYTVPTAVNDNVALYCKVGVPFVLGTTGGDRELLYRTVSDSKVYAVISPQMGKQVVAFLAAMEIMAEQFPGAFSGYKLQVMESHQASKLDLSGTAKAVISCFQKLGVSFDLDEVQQVRDPRLQVEMVGVPEGHLNGHAFHMYHLTSPDETTMFVVDQSMQRVLLMLYFSSTKRSNRRQTSEFMI